MALRAHSPAWTPGRLVAGRARSLVGALTGVCCLVALLGAALEGTAHAGQAEVSVGEPIEPYRAGGPASGWMEARAINPDGGPTQALLFYRSGRPARQRSCAAVGSERALRKYPVRQGGACLSSRGQRDPWFVSVTTGPRQPVVVFGQTNAAVTELQVSGPGGTFVVPRTRHGAFLVVYSRRASGTATLTARLRDGSSRTEVVELPPTFDPPGRVLASDPGGKPPWRAAAHLRRSGNRAGQTCSEVDQRTDFTTGSAIPFNRSVCGDLTADPVVADLAHAAPARGRDARPSDAAERRLVLWGAAGPEVKAVTALGPDGRRELPLAAAGRAFVTVYGPEVAESAVSLEVTLADGSVRHFATPRRLNAKRPKPAVRPRLAKPIDAALIDRGGSQVALSAALTAPATRVHATFLGKRIVMRPVAGDPAHWRGLFVASTERRTRPAVGRRYAVRLVVCATACVTRSSRVTLRRIQPPGRP